MLFAIAAFGRVTCLVYPAPGGGWWVSVVTELGFEQLGPCADAPAARQAAELHLRRCFGSSLRLPLHWYAFAFSAPD